MGRTPHRARRRYRCLAALALVVMTLGWVPSAVGKQNGNGNGWGHGNGHGHGNGNANRHGNGHVVQPPPVVAPTPPPAPVATPAPAPPGNGHGNGHAGGHVKQPPTPPQEPAKPTATPPPPSTPPVGVPVAQPPAASQPPRQGPRRGTTHRSPTRPRHNARHRRKPASNASRRRRGTVHGATHPAASVFATPATSGPALALARRAAGRGHDTPSRAHARGPGLNHPRKADRSPIVRTLERIVHVIPLAVKAIILMLGVLLVLASVAWFLHARTARYLRRHREMLLEEVGVLQGALLPTVPAELSRLQASVAYRPAEGMAAGGDFYDAFALDDGRVGIVVGDVAGHGKDALMHTALLRYTLRAYLEADLEPRGALQVAGRALDRGFETIATVVLAVYDPNARVLRYACAGHPPPLFLGRADHVPVTAASSPPMGAGLPTGLRQTTVSLPANSAVCFFTDGLIEARRDGQLIGRLGLAEIIRELGPDATATELLDRVADEADRVDDDMAACMFRVADGPVEAGSPRVEELEIQRGESLDATLRRFLVACGVNSRAVSNAIVRADQAMRRHHAVVVEASVRTDETAVAIRPANVESFASAEARRDATVLAMAGRR